MKKFLALLLVFVIMLPGCATTSTQPDDANADDTSFHDSTAVTTNLPDTQQSANSGSSIFMDHTVVEMITGLSPLPDGLDDLLIEQIGEQRMRELRSGNARPSIEEYKIALQCLDELGIMLDLSGTNNEGNPPQAPGQSFDYTVRSYEVGSDYKAASGNLSGWFTDGQEAEIMLSGFDFNNSGGELMFNHQKGIVTDGVHLLLADGGNNRVLIWNTLPEGNVAPDIVLGQPDFNSNYPGIGAGQMNWPCSVATDGQHVLVADTYNNRILIWNGYPTENGQPADIILDGGGDCGPLGSVPDKKSFGWPWGVWTDGTKVVVTSTIEGFVLIWNTFPTVDNQPADLYLRAGGHMGTPRTVTSDGTRLIIGDHNSVNTSFSVGDFVWLTFPITDDQPYDFFLKDPIDPQCAWLTGDFTDDGKLIMIGSTVHIWDSFPVGDEDKPEISITGYQFDGGDGASVAIAGERVYVSAYNGNRILVYNTIPDDASDIPDFAIGSPDIYTNTLDTHYFITNGVPATNGENLFVSSDFDRKLYVWKNIPDESGAYPDLYYTLPEAPWDNALLGETFVMAGTDTVYVWESLPLDGQEPDRMYIKRIGNVEFKDLRGVALDDKYFYLSDFATNSVYVWEGLPGKDESPLFTLNIDCPWRLSSDGEYLVVTGYNNNVISMYRVAELSASVSCMKIGQSGIFNGPQCAYLSQGSLFVSGTGCNKVFIWKNADDAYSGKEADTILGNESSSKPMICKDAFFWPAGLAFDGSYLWVGEFKFGLRLLRFDVN